VFFTSESQPQQQGVQETPPPVDNGFDIDDDIPFS
jgi:hypothetical protein